MVREPFWNASCQPSLQHDGEEYFLHKICHTLQKVIQITIPFVIHMTKHERKFAENISNPFVFLKENLLKISAHFLS
jgi:hypothetical protein